MEILGYIAMVIIAFLMVPPYKWRIFWDKLKSYKQRNDDWKSRKPKTPKPKMAPPGQRPSKYPGQRPSKYHPGGILEFEAENERWEKEKAEQKAKEIEARIRRSKMK